MYIEKIWMQENISISRGVVIYNYLVRPVNSLFTAKTQKTSLLETMFDLLMSVNMPGYLMIKPRGIDNTKIYKYYLDSYKKFGRPEHMVLAQNMMMDIKKINDKKERYQYDIILCFCDGREELKKRSFLNNLIGNKNTYFDKDMIELFESCENEIWKKLSMLGLNIKKICDKKAHQKLLQYIAIPTEYDIEDEYYSTPDPEKITYHYQRSGKERIDALYTKTLIASKFEIRADDDNSVDDVINCLQLESFPVDTFIKFDLQHTKEFKRTMQAKKVKVEKELKTYYNSSNTIDEEGRKAKALAEIGEKKEESIEKSKIRWQLFFRLRSNNEILLDKNVANLRKLLSSSNIVLSNEFGDQERLAENLFPWRSDFVKYVQLTDVKYFARFNWLGGIFIGEEHEGFIETYTKPGNIPVFTEISNTLTSNLSSSNSTTTVYAGETGSGKTQQADLRAFTNMIFKGMRVLCIDPKGDRDKKVKLLGNSSAHLRIGSKECQDGMFDAYLMYENASDCLGQAKKDIDSLARALNVGQSISFYNIEKAHHDMMFDFVKRKIKRPTFTRLIDLYLRKYDEMLAKELTTFKSDDMGRLFFANDETKYDAAFNLNKPYNLVTFDKLPTKNKNTGEFDPNRLESAIFAILFSRVQNIIDGFMKRFEGEEKILIFDEYKVYKAIDGGEEIVVNANRMCRSWFTHIFIITQALTDVGDGILLNTGQYFIGSLSSSKEIEFVLDYLKLTNNKTVKSALMDRSTDEGINIEKKYRFLFVDYNGRKCITRNVLPESFEEVFTTLKKDDSVPVTGTGNIHDEEDAKAQIEEFLKSGVPA